MGTYMILSCRFRALFFVLLGAYILYTFYLTAKVAKDSKHCFSFPFQAFTELRTMQFIQTRLKFIVGFMGVIILLATSIVYSKFGFGILEDNFVARLYTDYASVTHFLAFYALLNLYIYLMVYAYRYKYVTKLFLNATHLQKQKLEAS